MSFLGECALQLGVDRMTARFHQFRDYLLKQFLAVAHLPTPSPPENTVVINLETGTLEIVDGKPKLRNFQREDFLTYQLPFAYNPQAQCPKWQAFLDEVLADHSRQRVLAEFLGYVFTTSLKLEKALILQGSGANGKSVVFDVMTAMFGSENISHYSLQSLTTEYHRAMLSNKLLNYASEISSKMESEVFKKMTSGEPVEARLPYGRPFMLTRYAKFAFNGNDLPYNPEHNEAFFRRFLIIPFDVTISKDKRNPNLAKEIIATELSGVFNWVMDGLKHLLVHNRFSSCQAADDAVEVYRKESDSVALFLEEEAFEPDFSEQGAYTLQELYALYRAFATDCGYKSLGRNKFSQRLKTSGFSTGHKEVGTVVHAVRGEKKDVG